MCLQLSLFPSERGKAKRGVRSLPMKTVPFPKTHLGLGLVIMMMTCLSTIALITNNDVEFSFAQQSLQISLKILFMGYYILASEALWVISSLLGQAHHQKFR